jgi:copper chaperone CopZ
MSHYKDIGAKTSSGKGVLLTAVCQQLDNSVEKSQVSDMKTFTITGMTCAGCARKVEATLKLIAPDAIVTLDPPQVSATGATLSEMNSALGAIGKYRVSESTHKFTFPPFMKTYYPLFLVMGLIALCSLSAGSLMGWMMNFMAGFYIVFGAFKLLDVPAFAQSYSRYDVIAKVFNPWGFAYPFVELALGFGFLFGYDMIALSWTALVLSLIGAVGVIRSVARKQTIQCACLGTVFQLPMSTVTIVENLGMAVMAAWMIFMPM